MLLYAAAADAPSWTDKLEAWSTFGGAIFTATAVIVAFLVWRHDRRVRREDAFNADAAQARLVITSVTGPIGDQKTGWRGVSVTIHNNSRVHIFALRTQAAPKFLTWVLRPMHVGDIRGGASASVDLFFSEPVNWVFGEASENLAAANALVHVMVTFTDGEGRRWTRGGDDEPVPARVDEPEAGVFGLLVEYLHVLEFARWVGFQNYKVRLGTLELLRGRLARRNFYDPALPDDAVPPNEPF
ncbi:hypothetical protein [Actinoplanes sp. NPDC026619]|uniref:hypothetical protein n=1 Tax=Actinoplanes sp. NPDC026619 TaxID=3155798 RepID=UPI0033C6F879